MTDSTACERGWLGYNDYCFKIIPEKSTFTDAIKTCGSYNGYIMTTSSPVHLDFLKAMLTDVDQFSLFPDWCSGFLNQFLNERYLSADGTIIFSDMEILHDNTTTNGETVIAFNSYNLTFSETPNSINLPIICEKSRGLI